MKIKLTKGVKLNILKVCSILVTTTFFFQPLFPLQKLLYGRKLETSAEHENTDEKSGAEGNKENSEAVENGGVVLPPEPLENTNSNSSIFIGETQQVVGIQSISTPQITWPENNSYITTANLVKVDWTDVTGDNPPFEYKYESYLDASYTVLAYSSDWLTDSEIPTPHTQPAEYYLRVKARDASGEETDWSNSPSNPYKITVDNTPPTVNIDESAIKMVNGYACGLGDAIADDGLKIDITNWNFVNSGYVLQGRFFVSGGSFGPWFDISSLGTFTINGPHATFFAPNTMNTPEGPAGWEVRVVDGSGTVVSNTDSVNYIIVSDYDALACQGVIDLGFETAETGSLPGVGTCPVYTKDLSRNGGHSSLQVVKWEYIGLADHYEVTGYRLSGGVWIPYPSYTLPNSDYIWSSERFIDIDEANNLVTYTTYATNENAYAYYIEAQDSSNTPIGATVAVTTSYNCTFTVDRTPPTIPGAIGWDTSVPPEPYNGNDTGSGNYVTCNGIITTSDQRWGIWGQSDDDINNSITFDGYQRQVVYDDGINPPTLYNGYTQNYYAGPFIPGQGGANGGDGIYYVRVRAIDKAGNKSVEDDVWDSTPYTSTSDTGLDGRWCKLIINVNGPEAPRWVLSPIYTRLADGGDVVNMQFIESSSVDVDHYEYQFVSVSLDGTLKWSSAPFDMESYRPIVGCNIRDNVPGEICTWQNVEMQDGRRWIYRIRAVDIYGVKGEWSNWNSIGDTEFQNFNAEDFEYEDYINNTGAFSPANGYDTSVGGGFAIREQIDPVSMITSPVSGTVTNNPSINIEYESSDVDTAVKKVELWYSFNDPFGTYTKYAENTQPTGHFNFVFPYGDGIYCFYTIAEDIADDLSADLGEGNRQDVPNPLCLLAIIVDTVPPTTRMDATARIGIGSTIYNISNDELDNYSAVPHDGWYRRPSDGNGLGWYRRFLTLQLSFVSGGTIPEDKILYTWVDSTQNCPSQGDPLYHEYISDIASEIMGKSDGEYKLCYYGTDGINNENTHGVIFRKDTKAPKTTINTVEGQSFTPGETYFVSDGILNVNFVGEDNQSGLARGRVIVFDTENCNDSNWQDHHWIDDTVYNPGTHVYDASVDLSGLSEGPHCVSVRNRDRAAILKNITFTIVIDTTPPIVSLSVGNSFGAGTLFIDVDIEDKYSNVHNATYEILDSGGNPVLSGDINDGFWDVGSYKCSVYGGTSGYYDESNCVAPHENVDVSMLPSGNYDVRICGIDQSGNVATGDDNTIPTGSTGLYCYRYTIYIDNTPPTVDDLDDQTWDEGSQQNLGFLSNKGAYDDYGLSQLCVTLNFYDPSGNLTPYPETCYPIDSLGTGGSFPPNMDEFQFVVDTALFDEGRYEFTYYVTDIAGYRSDCDEVAPGEQSCEVVFTINNVPPQIDFQGDQTIDEGSTATFAGSFTDPSINEFEFNRIEGLSENILGKVIQSVFSNMIGDDDQRIPDDEPWNVWIDYGDGSPSVHVGDFTLGDFVDGKVTLSLPDHTYGYVTKDTQYTVTLTVCESDPESNNNPTHESEGECSTAQATVTIRNVSPSVYISPATSSITVGQSVALIATGNGGNAPLSYSWSCTNGQVDSGNTITFTSSNVGTYTCTATVKDSDGDSSMASATITVNPVPTPVTQTGQGTVPPTYPTGGGEILSEEAQPQQEINEETSKEEIKEPEVKAVESKKETEKEERKVCFWWIVFGLLALIINTGFVLAYREKIEKRKELLIVTVLVSALSYILDMLMHKWWAPSHICNLMWLVSLMAAVIPVGIWFGIRGLIEQKKME